MHWRIDEPQQPSRPERRVFTVGELNRAIQAALQASFPGTVWVRGEVQRLSRNRSGHIYFELHGEEGGNTLQIKVAALKWDRRRHGLDRWFDGTDPDLQIRDKIEVCLEGVVDFYPNFGSLSLKMVGVDKAFTLGQLEAKRREVLAWLKAENLLERNATIPMSELPLRVGLVTSAGSAAEHDFLAGLQDAPYGFRVARADCRMMGEAMVPQVTAAIRGLAAADVDVIVVTRGGGSRADLSWFDHRDVAAAVALCPVPVVAAIGHEIDRSITDVVAHASCKTPTAAAQLLVDRVAAADARVVDAAERLAAEALRISGDARGRLRDVAARLQPGVERRVHGWRLALQQRRDRALALADRTLRAAGAADRERRRRLAAGADRLLRENRDALARDERRLDPARLLARWPRRRAEIEAYGQRIVRQSARAAATAARRLDGLEDKIRLLDPRRLLARGWTLTLDVDGKAVSTVAGLEPGSRLTTRFRDGAARSVVESIEPDPGD